MKLLETNVSLGDYFLGSCCFTVCRLKKRSTTHGVQTSRGKMMSQRRLLGLSHRELRSWSRAGWIFVPQGWNESFTNIFKYSSDSPYHRTSYRYHNLYTHNLCSSSTIKLKIRVPSYCLKVRLKERLLLTQSLCRFINSKNIFRVCVF